MRIVVPLRRLRGRPDGAPAPEPLGCCERMALAAAAAVRARVPGSHVVALAAGPADREDPALHAALAAGADRAVRVSDSSLDSVDYQGIARALAPAVRHLGFDVVLVGDRSEDELQGAIGPALAEALGIPHLTGVLDLALQDRDLLATRRDAGVLRTLRLPLPALAAVVTFPGARLGERVAAAGTQVEGLDFTTLGLQALELKHRDRLIGRAQPVRVTRNATVVKDPEELIGRLREDRLLG